MKTTTQTPNQMTLVLSKATPWLSIAILALLAFVCIRSLTAEPGTNTNTLTTERLTEIRDDSVQHWKDIAGREHGEKLAAQADVKTLRAVYPMLDSVLRTLKIHGDQLQTLSAIGTSASGTVRPRVDTVLIDKNPTPHFAYSDRWIDLDGVLTDPLLIHYTTRDSLIVTTYSKRKWFLGAKRTYVDAYSLNPANHVTGLAGLQVYKERPRRFSLGPYIGYGYDGTR